MKPILYRTVTLLLLLTALPLHVLSRLQWIDGTTYDFGTWKEAAGPRTGSVRVVNLGPDTTIIMRVRPSCGCTGAEYNDAPLAPGDTATISFTYNPAHRPGRFEKTVKVYIGEAQHMHVINIKGTIIGKPTTLQADFPYEVGPIRLSDTIAVFKPMPYGQARHIFIKGYNQSEQTIYPNIMGAPEALDVRLTPDTVHPGDAFSISMYYNSRKEPLLGASEYHLCLTPAPDTEPQQITVLAEVLPPAAMLTPEQLALAPRISVPAQPIELSGAKPGARQKFKFDVTNAGKSILTLNRVYSRAEAIKITRMPTRLKSGAKATVEGYIDLSRVQGPAYGFIVEVLSNDPNTPSVKVRLVGQTPR